MKNKPLAPRRDFSRVSSQARILEIFSELSARPQTDVELAAATFISRAALQPYLVHLHSEGYVHVQRWTREPVAGSRPYLRAVWALGNRPDAPRPPALTPSEIYRRWYERTVAAPEERPSSARSLRRKAARQAAAYRARRMKRIAEYDPALAAAARFTDMFVRTQGRNKTPTPAQVAEMVERRKAGENWTSIARAVGVSRSTVARHCTRLGTEDA